MKTSIAVGSAASGKRHDWQEVADFVVEAERIGVDVAWSAEAWGQDAVAPLAFLAARTSKMKLGTGIMQISARTPSMRQLNLSHMNQPWVAPSRPPTCTPASTPGW